MATRPGADIEFAMASIWDVRARAEKAVEVLGALDAPEHLIEAVERSRAELAEVAERLDERLASARKPPDP